MAKSKKSILGKYGLDERNYSISMPGDVRPSNPKKKPKKKVTKKKLEREAKKAGREIKKVGRKIVKAANTDVGRAGLVGGAAGTLALGPVGGAAAAAAAALSTKKRREKKGKKKAKKNPESTIKLSTAFGNLLLDYHKASENVEHVAASALRGERVELRYVKKARADLNKIRAIQTQESEREQIGELVDALDRVIAKCEKRPAPRSNPKHSKSEVDAFADQIVDGFLKAMSKRGGPPYEGSTTVAKAFRVYESENWGAGHAPVVTSGLKKLRAKGYSTSGRISKYWPQKNPAPPPLHKSTAMSVVAEPKIGGRSLDYKVKEVKLRLKKAGFTLRYTMVLTYSEYYRRFGGKVFSPIYIVDDGSDGDISDAARQLDDMLDNLDGAISASGFGWDMSGERTDIWAYSGFPGIVLDLYPVAKSDFDKWDRVISAFNKKTGGARRIGNPARAFSLKAQVKSGRQSKAKKAAGRAARSSSVASSVASESLRKRMAKINPSTYQNLLPGMSDAMLDKEHKAIGTLITGARKHPDASKRVVSDLIKVRGQIVSEKKARRNKGHRTTVSNPITVSRRVGKFKGLTIPGHVYTLSVGFSPSEDELRLLRKYKMMDHLDGVPPRQIESIVARLRRQEKAESKGHRTTVSNPQASVSSLSKRELKEKYPTITKMTQRYLSARKRYKALITSPGSTDAEMSRAKKKFEGAERELSLFAEIKNIPPSQLEDIVRHMETKRPRASRPRSNPLVPVTERMSDKRFRDAISRNISAEMKAGKPQKQAIAIALNQARSQAPKKSKKIYGARPNPSRINPDTGDVLPTKNSRKKTPKKKTPKKASPKKTRRK